MTATPAPELPPNERCLGCGHVRRTHVKRAGLCLAAKCFCFGVWPVKEAS